MTQVPEEHYDCFAYGLKRGGHHAVVNWILRHSDSWIYYNNCLFDGGVIKSDQEVKEEGERPYKMKMLSFEDRFQGRFELVSNKPKRNVIILRDVYNTFASRFKKRRDVVIKDWASKMWGSFNDVSIWKEYACEFIGTTNFLGADAIKINYNKWFSDTEYRKSISKNFGEFTDAGLQDVVDFSRGSSFDNFDLDKKAQSMDVTGRYKEFQNDEEYIRCLSSDKEIKDMNREIFGFSLDL